MSFRCYLLVVSHITYTLHNHTTYALAHAYATWARVECCCNTTATDSNSTYTTVLSTTDDDLFSPFSTAKKLFSNKTFLALLISLIAAAVVSAVIIVVTVLIMRRRKSQLRKALEEGLVAPLKDSPNMPHEPTPLPQAMTVYTSESTGESPRFTVLCKRDTSDEEPAKRKRPRPPSPKGNVNKPKRLRTSF